MNITLPAFPDDTHGSGLELTVHTQESTEVTYMNPDEALASISSELSKAHDLVAQLESKNSHLQNTVLQLENKLATGIRDFPFIFAENHSAT